jgi:hypothetical protein
MLARERCRIIARHLARHSGARRDDGEPDDERAWLVLKSLYANGDPATTPWEAAQPSGAPPAVTWPIPTAGAFAALLGLCGTGLTAQYSPQGQPPLWSEQSGPLQEFGEVRDHRNAPLPTLIPAIQPPPGAPSTYVDLVNGFALSRRDDRDLGGAEGFSVTLSGVLLVEAEGRYRFAAGAPTAEDERPSIERGEHWEWSVTLRRGANTWVLLSRRWPGQADTDPEAEQHLRRGAYDITVEYHRPEPHFDDPDELRRRHAGLQVKYAGPDTGGDLVTIPHRRLYIGQYDQPPIAVGQVGQVAANTLAATYVSSLSDIRRTYQRAFKALLLATRFDLSARRTEDGQSELGFILAHPDRFAGTSFHRAGAGFTEHRAQFDINFLPVLDSYPAVPGDDRAAPPQPRQAAMFDWWERLFDYTELRRQNAAHRDGHRPRLWRLFAAAEAANPTIVLQLMPHLQIPLDHNDLVQRYFGLMALLGHRVRNRKDDNRGVEEHRPKRDARTYRQPRRSPVSVATADAHRHLRVEPAAGQQRGGNTGLSCGRGAACGRTELRPGCDVPGSTVTRRDGTGHGSGCCGRGAGGRRTGPCPGNPGSSNPGGADTGCGSGGAGSGARGTPRASANHGTGYRS